MVSLSFNFSTLMDRVSFVMEQYNYIVKESKVERQFNRMPPLFLW